MLRGCSRASHGFPRTASLPNAARRERRSAAGEFLLTQWARDGPNTRGHTAPGLMSNTVTAPILSVSPPDWSSNAIALPATSAIATSTKGWTACSSWSRSKSTPSHTSNFGLTCCTIAWLGQEGAATRLTPVPHEASEPSPTFRFAFSCFASTWTRASACDTTHARTHNASHTASGTRADDLGAHTRASRSYSLWICASSSDARCWSTPVVTSGRPSA